MDTKQLLQRTEEQIQERGLSTPAGWGGFKNKTVISVSEEGLWLVHGSGWYKYSRRAGTWWQEAVYLCGHEDGQDWAVRVPSSCGTVPAALSWLTPKAVKEARRKDMPVVRQGDIYFCPMRIQEDDFSQLFGTRHGIRPRKGGGYTVVHPQHPPKRLSGKYVWRAYQQRQVDGQSRRAGD